MAKQETLQPTRTLEILAFSSHGTIYFFNKQYVILQRKKLKKLSVSSIPLAVLIIMTVDDTRIIIINPLYFPPLTIDIATQHSQMSVA